MTTDNPYLIAHHTRRELDSIRVLWPSSLRPAKATDSEPSHAANVSDVIAADVLDTREACRRDLRNHTRDVARALAGLDDPRPSTSDVLGMVAYLYRHAVDYALDDTIAAAQLSADMRKHAHRLKALVIGDRTRVIVVGRCPVMVWTDPDDISAGVERCHGELVAKFPRYGRPEEIICDNRPDLHSWTKTTWHTLGQEITLEQEIDDG